jgi:hypothetical protein
MPPEPPLWRRTYNSVERTLAPRADAAVRADEFAAALARVNGARRMLQRVVDSRTRGLWHLLNLPAGSDVRALRRQIGELDRELRLLRAEVDRSRREAPARKPSSTTQRKARSRGGDSGK